MVGPTSLVNASTASTLSLVPPAGLYVKAASEVKLNADDDETKSTIPNLGGGFKIAGNKKYVLSPLHPGFYEIEGDKSGKFYSIGKDEEGNLVANEQSPTFTAGGTGTSAGFGANKDTKDNSENGEDTTGNGNTVEGTHENSTNYTASELKELSLAVPTNMEEYVEARAKYKSLNANLYNKLGLILRTLKLCWNNDPELRQKLIEEAIADLKEQYPTYKHNDKLREEKTLRSFTERLNKVAGIEIRFEYPPVKKDILPLKIDDEKCSVKKGKAVITGTINEGLRIPLSSLGYEIKGSQVETFSSYTLLPLRDKGYGDKVLQALIEDKSTQSATEFVANGFEYTNKEAFDTSLASNSSYKLSEMFKEYKAGVGKEKISNVVDSNIYLTCDADIDTDSTDPFTTTVVNAINETPAGKGRSKFDLKIKKASLSVVAGISQTTIFVDSVTWTKQPKTNIIALPLIVDNTPSSTTDWDGGLKNYTDFFKWNPKSVEPKQTSDSPRERNAYKWITEQRLAYEKNELSQTQIDAITTINTHHSWYLFPPETWEPMYKLYGQFKKDNPDTTPSVDSKDNTDRKLAKWLEIQNKLYFSNQLQDNKTALMNSIDHKWEQTQKVVVPAIATQTSVTVDNTSHVQTSKELEWEEELEKCFIFKANKSRFPYITAEKGSKEYESATWLNYQKENFQGLTRSQLNQLRYLCSGNLDYVSQTWLDDLKAYQEYLSVNHERPARGSDLAEWYQQQKDSKPLLGEKQHLMQETFGINWAKELAYNDNKYLAPESSTDKNKPGRGRVKGAKNNGVAGDDETWFQNLKEYQNEKAKDEFWEPTQDTKLYGWLARNRSLKNNTDMLSPEREDALNAVKGHEWTVNDTRWKKQYAALKKFKKEHKTDPKNSGNKQKLPEDHLALWLNHQKVLSEFNLLPADKINALKDAGVEWAQKKVVATKVELNNSPNTTNQKSEQVNKTVEDKKDKAKGDEVKTDIDEKNQDDVLWEARRKKYENEKAQDPSWEPNQYKDKDLFSWLANNRYLKRHNLLPADRVDSLKIDGHIWDPSDAKWEKKLLASKKFREEHQGNGPKHSDDPSRKDESKLNMWERGQTHLYIHGLLVPKERATKWETLLGLTSTNTKDTKEPKNAENNNQTSNNGPIIMTSITPSLVPQPFNEISRMQTNTQDDWPTNYFKCSGFKTDNSGRRPYINSENKKEKILAEWLNNQIQNFSNLSSGQQKSILTLCDNNLDYIDDAWRSNLAAYKEYLAIYSVAPKEGSALAVWYKQQVDSFINKTLIGEKKELMLKTFGDNWVPYSDAISQIKINYYKKQNHNPSKLNDDKWNGWLKLYKKGKIDPNWEPDPNNPEEKALSSWIRRQRFAHNKNLSEERETALNEVKGHKWIIEKHTSPKIVKEKKVPSQNKRDEERAKKRKEKEEKKAAAKEQADAIYSHYIEIYKKHKIEDPKWKPSQFSTDTEERELAIWLKGVKSAYKKPSDKKGALSDAQKKEFEEANNPPITQEKTTKEKKRPPNMALKDDAVFYNWLEIYKKFKATDLSKEPKEDSDDPVERGLYHWLNNNRYAAKQTGKGTLSEERRKALDSVPGHKWVLDNRRDTRVAEYKEFKLNNYGKEPHRYKPEQRIDEIKKKESSLAGYMKEQEKLLDKGELTTEQENQLRAAGWTYTTPTKTNEVVEMPKNTPAKKRANKKPQDEIRSHDDRWNTWRKMYIKGKKDYGLSWEPDEETQKGLYNWHHCVTGSKYKDLSPERKKALSKIPGFVSDSREKLWDDTYQLYLQFKKDNGGREPILYSKYVRHDPKKEKEYRLALWLMHQQVTFSKIKPERLAKLKAAGWAYALINGGK